MPFLEHLQELRTTLRNSAIAIIITTAIAFVFKSELWALLASPLVDAWIAAQSAVSARKPEMITTGPTEHFMVYMKLSFVVGLLVASPIIFRELWRFISPGLYPRERRWGLFFVVSSVVLFVGGAAFAYKFVLAPAYKFFLSYAADNMGMFHLPGTGVDVKLSQPFDIRPMISMDAYFDLTVTLILVFGLVFELPLVLSILAMLGIVSAKMLWKFNRYAILIFAILGAILTPGDVVVGQLAMAGALTVLYNLSIVVALIVGKKRKEDEAKAEAELD